MDLSAHLGSRTIQSGTVLEHQLGGVVKCYLHRDVCMVNLSVKIFKTSALEVTSF